MYSNFSTEGVLKITDNVKQCMRFCALNKELWQTNKIGIIREMGKEFPEFYEKFPRIVHNIGNCDDIGKLTTMLRMLHEVEHGKMTIDEAHVKFNEVNNYAYGKTIMEDIKEREKNGEPAIE
jgi:uncharacterized membrane protein YjjP (DUF1212 family)